MPRRQLQCVVAVIAAVLIGCTEQAPSEIRTGVEAYGSARDAADVPSSVVWQVTASGIVARRNVSPIVAIRAYGLLGVAQYAAIVAADDARNGAESPGLGVRAKLEVRRGAVAGASAQVLTYLFPPEVTSIEAQVAAEGAVGSKSDQERFADGVAIGRASGAAIVLRGRADGFAKPNGSPQVWDPSTLLVGPTLWKMDADAVPQVPAGFQFPGIRPYYLTSASQFRSATPPTDLSAAIAEVVSSVNARTTTQVDLARSWNLNLGTVTPGGYWNQVAARYIAEDRLDEREAAHVFALTSSAGMDAIIGCWDSKYYYLVRRPWMVAPLELPNALLIIGRPNHPSYPSGHSCVSSAMATVLGEFFPGRTAWLQEQVVEAGMSRIWAGIHFRFDVEAGQSLGRSVAQWAIRYDRERGLLTALAP